MKTLAEYLTDQAAEFERCHDGVNEYQLYLDELKTVQTELSKWKLAAAKNTAAFREQAATIDRLLEFSIEKDRALVEAIRMIESEWEIGEKWAKGRAAMALQLEFR